MNSGDGWTASDIRERIKEGEEAASWGGYEYTGDYSNEMGG